MSINKQKMLRILYVYVAVILILVFFSKTIYNFSLPKVTVVMPKSGKLTKELEAYGVVLFSETYDIYAGANGQLEEIYVEKGDSIDVNTTIARYKTLSTETEAKHRALHYSIDRIKNEMDASNLYKKALQKEIQALNGVTEVQEADPSFILELQEIKRLMNLQEEAIQKTKILYDAGALSKEDYDKEIEKLDTLVSSEKQKEAQIEKQKQESNTKYNEDKKERLDLLNQKETDLAKTELAIDKVNIDMHEAESTLEALASTKDQEPMMKVKGNGVIISVEKQNGSFVSQGEKIATVGVNNHTFVSEITCLKAEGKFINVGDEATISTSGADKRATATVFDIQPIGDSLKLKLTFQSTQFNGSEYVSINFHKQTITYDVLVPNEAIIKEAFNNYVWVVCSRDGALGVEYYTVKLRIMVADSDFSYTAVSKGIDFIAPVVVGKNKDLMMNSRVTQMD